MKHPRNIHQERYPLEQLAETYPPLQAYLKSKPDGGISINFAEPKAVKALNGALLAYYYQVTFWDIPAGYLCPPIPGRADYVHYLADLLASDNQGQVPTGQSIQGLDIGTGANLVYPIIANRIYGWKMLGSDIDSVSIQSANVIIASNSVLAGKIKVKHQPHSQSIFDGIIQDNDYFAFCMCNPPFHSSAEQALAGSRRKVNNLAKYKTKRTTHGKVEKQNDLLNFAGQANELWCQGGELRFIQLMITQSYEYQRQVGWFSSLVSKKSNMASIYKSLAQIGVADIKTFEMAQGQKVSRFVAWRY